MQRASSNVHEQKKRRTRTAEPSAAEAGTAAPGRSSPTPTPSAPERARWHWLLLAIAFGAVGLWAWESQPKPAVPTSAALSSFFSPRNLCKRPPTFLSTLGFGRGASISTSERDLLGIAIVEFDPSTKQRVKYFQHPSWQQAGQLSAFALDRNGDLYAVPARA
ncbi:hypothetical protein HC761_01970 [bacterium]|nr:hypothetical protein [bacterium]